MGCLKDWAEKGLTLTLVSRVSMPLRPYMSGLFAYHLDTSSAENQHTRQRAFSLRGYDLLKRRVRILRKCAQENETVRQPNSDLDLIRKFIDLIEAERIHNSFQDKEIRTVKQQCEQLESRVSSLESIVQALRYGMDRHAELEWLENPYSLDRSPRCNH